MNRAPSAVQLARLDMQAGRFSEAIGALLRQLRRSPNDLPTLLALGEAHIRLGQFDRAEFYLSRAVALDPASAIARSDHGHTLLTLGRTTEAIARFREVLDIDPTIWMASSGLAQALTNCSDFRAAIEVAREGTRRHPERPELFDHLARALISAARIEEALAAARGGLAIAPTNSRLLATLAVALTYSDAATPDEVADAYRASGRAMLAGNPPAPMSWSNSLEPDRPLRVGYISPDLRDHPVPYFIEPIFSHHDPAGIRLHVYSTTRRQGPITARLKSAVEGRTGVWMDAGELSADALGERMRSDRLDILVELAGHSWSSKLALLLRNPAPIVVNYLGWPTTTGLPTVHWRLVDSVTDPPGSERHCTERLARLEGCFLCYAGRPDAPDSVLPEGPPVFASFNGLVKITRTCVRAWAAVLLATPGSRMILKAEQLDQDEQRARITAMFRECGIDRSRLDLLGRMARAEDHLACYNRVHVALDTFPYNGTTTTCEALWMGVPVITPLGRMHAGRVGASLLTAIGGSDWIARDEPEFVRTAASLAQDRARLADLRRTLRDRVRASPLCDASAFTRRLESMYRDMWHAWCRTKTLT